MNDSLIIYYFIKDSKIGTSVTIMQFRTSLLYKSELWQTIMVGNDVFTKIKAQTDLLLITNTYLLGIWRS